MLEEKILIRLISVLQLSFIDIQELLIIDKANNKKADSHKNKSDQLNSA